MNRTREIAKSLRRLLLGIMAVLPMVMVTPIALAEREVDFSQAELDQMLAPIALYPDTVLSQVLIASTYPLEVVQADRWVRTNKDLKPEDALKFAENKDWDPSVKALVAFPDILKRMSEDIDWTQRVGDAFLDDEKSVMDTVQRLRKRAYASGNLEKAQHIRVEEDDSNIIIEPAEERVVYVPVYDTRVVYGNWWWPDYPPVYWNYPGYTYVSGFYWGPSIFIGSTFFYSSCHWHDRRVVVVDRSVYYRSEPHFYTGRSIARFEGAREWHHDPVHRHGVAYFNDRQQHDFGSRHNSYQNDRQYRDQFRDHRDDNDHRGDRGANRDNWQDHNNWQNRSNGPENNWQAHNQANPQVIRGQKRDAFNLPANQVNVSNTQTQPIDRATQLQERMNRSNDDNGRHWDGNTTHIRSEREPVQPGFPAHLRTENPVSMPDNASAEARQRSVRQIETNNQQPSTNESAQRGFSMPRQEQPTENRTQPSFDRREPQRGTDFTPPNRSEARNETHNEGGRERVMRGSRRDKDND